jgi:hypothetical protein
VRITEVGRTSAAAEIVGGVPENGGSDDGDKPQRRRGRRGGRGRKKTPAPEKG